MVDASWSIFVGIIVFIIGLIFAASYYVKYRKIYLVSLIASISTYVFSIFYVWDVYELNKNWVLLILFISTVLMLLLGKYFSKIELSSKVHTSLKEKEV